MLKRLPLTAVLPLSAPAKAQQRQVEAVLEAAPKGSRFGRHSSRGELIVNFDFTAIGDSAAARTDP